MNPSDMMDQTAGWMSGGIVIWTLIGIVVGVLMIVLINRLTRK